MNYGSIISTALAWAVGGGLLAWLVTLPLHRRSLAWLMASVVLTGTVASVSAVVGNVHAMFISMNELAAVVTVSVVAGVVAAVSAAVAARRLTRDNRALRAAVEAIGQGRQPDPQGPRPSTQPELHAELAATARRLAESRDREQALERSRRELIAWISHDLRAPLAGLRAMAEALEDGFVDDTDRYYKQIRVQVDQLSGMVDDLFDLSRMQAGAFALDTERVSLADLVSDCLAALDPLAQAAGVELTGHRGATATVTGNAAELNRALTNLVANAIQHTGPGGRVEVRVRAEAAEAQLYIRDQCGGIPDAAIDRVFEIGYRHEPARTPVVGETGGAGLGLAITRGIVTAHAGSIDVRNVADGCEFRVLLPVTSVV
jgi:signal transduction histidine kinase